MATKEKKTNSKLEKQEDHFYYLNDSVKDYDFSDFVRINSIPRGMILGFGKFQVTDKKFAICKEILVPYEVAEALADIIKNTMRQLIESKQLKMLDPKDGAECDDK